jgi:hypothetical protein
MRNPALVALSLFVFASSAQASSFIAHEWGTFTSVQGSDGILLEGLQHAEEPLPPFVYGRDTGKPLDTEARLRPHPESTKRFDATMASGTLLAVNEKLETPVIYFYADHALKASIDVRFPGGVISEWYPNATSFSPELGGMRTLANGKMKWNVDIQKEALPVPAVAPEDIWAPARNVNSNYVTNGTENEKFIFYRGLGRFETPIRIRTAENEIRISNPSPQTIPAAFLIRFNGTQGAIRALGSVAANSEKQIANPFRESDFADLETYLARVSTQLEASLRASGLYPDEAHAMVATWSKSYFRTPGNRVLYVLPRAWTDRILPLTIQPRPNSLVRTLVGRVEIMPPSEETALVHEVATSDAKSGAVLLNRLGRFAEAKLLRVQQLDSSAPFRAKAKQLLRSVQ